MSQIIVHSSIPVALLGGAQIAPQVLNILQSKTTTFVAADGGADHLVAAGMMPQAVIGDLDSLSAAARTKFHDVLHFVDDQSTTDFEKVLMRVAAPVVLAAGFLGGRLDHTFAVLNRMARASCYDVILLSADDVCFLARRVTTQFKVPTGTRVGLLPMADVQVTTSGLRWDVQDVLMQPAGMTSTSNETAQDTVTIAANGPLLITLPLAVLDTAITVVSA